MNKLRNFKYLFFLVLPIIAVAVWYSPVLFKGYSVSPMQTQIILGKNIAKTGMYAAENDLNVILSSGLIKEEGHISSLGNKLTGYLYAQVFKTFGFLNWNQLILFPAVLSAITLLIFSFLVFYLFNFRISLFFSLIYIFSPFVWRIAISPGTYEFALFFISLFFLFYFFASPRPSSVEAGGEAGQKPKRGFVFFILSGLFLALACLAKDAFLLFIPVLFIYLFLRREKRLIIFIFIPLFIALSIFYLPDFLAGRNAYSLLLPTAKISRESVPNDFIYYGEFYPDPYTYHFDKESFLKDYAMRRDSQGLIPSLYLQKGAVNIDAKAYHSSFGRRILLSLLLLADHMGRFVSLEQMGGPSIFLLMLLGCYFLRKNQRQLFWLFASLILGCVFMFSFVVLVGRDHLMDFGWILALLAALGLLSLISILETHFKLDEKKTFFLSGFILAMVLYGLLLADHVYFGRAYDNKDSLMVLTYASKIEKLNISDKDIIAVGGSGDFFSALSLNYLEDKSTVVFQQGTVKKLLENGELDSVFKTFGVTHILGYPEDLSEKMAEAAGVVNIGSGSGNAGTDERPLTSMENYSTKNWIMNFIR